MLASRSPAKHLSTGKSSMMSCTLLEGIDIITLLPPLQLRMKYKSQPKPPSWSISMHTFVKQDQLPWNLSNKTQKKCKTSPWSSQVPCMFVPLPGLPKAQPHPESSESSVSQSNAPWLKGRGKACPETEKREKWALRGKNLPWTGDGSRECCAWDGRGFTGARWTPWRMETKISLMATQPNN